MIAVNRQTRAQCFEADRAAQRDRHQREAAQQRVVPSGVEPFRCDCRWRFARKRRRWRVGVGSRAHGLVVDSWFLAIRKSNNDTYHFGRSAIVDAV